MPHTLQNRRWMVFFPSGSSGRVCRLAEPLPGAFLRQLSLACRSRRVPFVEFERQGKDPAALRGLALRKEGETIMASKGRSKIFPFLWYAKEAEEAARFYASIFPDSRVDRVTPMLSESPSGPPGSVKVVDFTLLGQRFQAMTAGPHHEFNDAISMFVLCDDQAELDRYWNALIEGGGKPQACGWLIDRFGLRWQIVPAILDELMRDKDPARSKRVTDAMLQMVKLDIAALEKAYRS
jgi:predicted 3-demethylubiquinone-9 3-methyltransferase (glyoxalase superfamily)